MEKVYIGKVEAFELLQGWEILKMPKKGKEVVHVPCINELIESGLTAQAIGIDDGGYYIREVIIK